MKRPSLLLLLCFLILSPVFSQQDAPGSEDHPLITRYPGSSIVWYDVQQFEQYDIATGPVTGYRTIDDWLEVEGKVTRIYYEIEGVRSLMEIYQNYLQALRQADFELLAQGAEKSRNVGKGIGGGSWMKVQYAANPLPSNGLIQLLNGSPTVGGDFFIAGKLERPTGTAYAVIGGHQYKEDKNVIMVDIIEAEPMEGNLISVDADAMSKAIDLYGKVALYGIFFEFDQDQIKAESKPALDEIAALLKKRPQLSLYVVGHTDMKGNLTYNLGLSERRAKAVVETLVSQYGIARARLEAQGVGPLVPVSTNKQDQGRSQNRRVELVEKS